MSEPPLLYVLERYPELSQTFVERELVCLQRRNVPFELLALEPGLTVPGMPAPVARAHYPSERSPSERVLATVRLSGRAPRAVGDFLARERFWPPGPSGRARGLARLAPWVPLARRARHLHAHFAAEATDIARLLSAMSDTPFSFAAHAYDALYDPAALRHNLAAADFCVTACEYNRRCIEQLAPDQVDKVHVVVVGADLERFRRRRPYQAGGPVVGVGRLVAKKGFADLVEAAGRMRSQLGQRDVLIVGEGPERPALERLIARSGAPVRLLGALPPDEVRDLLEAAALAVLPCVVGPDGDRDSMPVVLKEAMALELPVVGTDEVGLPELITRDRGRLVPAHDPSALAAAIGEILALGFEARVALGRAGRAFVEECCDDRVQTDLLLKLIDGRQNLV